MLILNCGGTLNKRYNAIDGELEVPFDNYALEEILSSVNFDYDLAGTIYKDSLEMDVTDRRVLASIVMESKHNKFLIIHGTDTMSLSAEFLDEMMKDKKIVFTGSMKPYEIDSVEASLNIGMAIGFLKSLENNGVYICMSGHVVKYDGIKKNKDLGKFELVN